MKYLVIVLNIFWGLNLFGQTHLTKPRYSGIYNYCSQVRLSEDGESTYSIYYYINSGSYTDKRGSLITKYNSTGAILWEKKVMMAAGDGMILPDGAGGIIFSLSGNGIVKLDTLDFNCTRKKHLLGRLDGNGNLLWVKQLNFRVLLPKKIENGQFYFSATFNNTDTIIVNNSLTFYPGTADRFLGKCDVNGDFLWGEYAEGGTKIDYKGGVICVHGKIYGSLTLGTGGTSVVLDQSNGVEYLACYDYQGTRLWHKQIPTQAATGEAISVNSSRIALTGNFVDSLTIDNQVFRSSAGLDSYVVEFSYQGTLEKSITVSGEDNQLVRDILIQDSGELYVGGTTAGAFKIAQTTITPRFAGSFFLHLNENNQPILLKSNESGSGQSEVRSIDVNTNNKVFGGNFYSKIVFDGQSLSGGYGSYVMIEKSAVSIQESEKDDTVLLLFPVPTKDVFKFKLNFDEKVEKLIAYNTNTQTISLSWEINEGVYSVHTENLSPGIYIIKVITAQNRYTGKFVIN